MNKTSLHKLHLESGAKLVDFSGWHMPISYFSPKNEHLEVRTNVGMFDVSHMSEFMILGKEAKEFISHISINNLNKISDHQSQYSALLNEQGGMIDDIIVYRLSDSSFMICSNAGNFAAVSNWLTLQAKRFDVELKDISEKTSLIALQGPKSTEYSAIISECVGIKNITELEFMGFRVNKANNSLAMVSRGGYTGEDGFEIFSDHETAKKLWQKLQEAGVKPIGLGARDSLRLEAGLLLHGQDCNDETTPIESSISWVVDKNPKDCIGYAAAIESKNHPKRTHLLSFLMEDKGIARTNMDVYIGQEKVGIVTSGTYLPTLEKSGGFVRLSRRLKAGIDKIEIDIRGKRKTATIEKRPLYKRK